MGLNNLESRHFIVFYNFSHDSGGRGVGMATLSTDGGFLNQKKTILSIKAGIEREHRYLDPMVCITSILEISASDFEDWSND